MNTKIYFTIKTGKKFEEEDYTEVQTDFMLEFDEERNCIGGESRNPCSTWGNYGTWVE